RSLSLEFEWNTSKDPLAELPNGAVAIVAFAPSWPVVNIKKAKYLVMYAKQSDPDKNLDLKIAITAASVDESEQKTKTETGLIGLSQFADGKKIGADWTRVVIPLSVMPDMDKINRKTVQRLRLELEGRPPRDKKTWIMLDDVYFTDVTLVTPPEN